MASLVGQQLKDTYDSLLKTSDNDALGSYKEITDGSGNGSNLYLGTGGNVGIGASSPSGKLQVEGGRSHFFSGDAFSVALAQTSAQGNYAYLGTDTDGDFNVYDTSGNPRLTVEQGGNVGIGTTSPGHPLTVTANPGSADTPVAWIHNSGNATSYDGTVISTVNDGSDVEVLHVRTNNTTYANGTSLMLVRGDGNVGIGTTSPDRALHVNGSVRINDGYSLSMGAGAEQRILAGGTSNNTYLTFSQWTGASFTERMRIDSSGNVGIGVSPIAKLHVNDTTYPALRLSTATSYSNIYHDGTTGSITYSADDGGAIASSSHQFYIDGGEKMRILSGGGITFNGDTASSNALDDYEEGTWTMGISFDNASVGVSYLSNTGTYTKIGRKVTVTGYINLSNKGTSTGTARITGLPFSVPNSAAYYSAPSLWFDNVSFANQFQAHGQTNTTVIILQEITEAGTVTSLTDANFANNSDIILSFTYFV